MAAQGEGEIFRLSRNPTKSDIDGLFAQIKDLFSTNQDSSMNPSYSVILAWRIGSSEDETDLVTLVKPLTELSGTEASFNQLRDSINRQALVIADKYQL